MSTSTNHDTELDLSIIEHLEFEVPCDSIRCARDWGLGSHAARWVVMFECGHDFSICDARLAAIQAYEGVGARMRCRVCREPLVVSAVHPIR